MITEPYQLVAEIKKYALDNKVPIMQDEGIDYLINYIKDNKIESILEVGTAIGYSSIMMALSNPKIKITTIERNHDSYLEAVKNIKKMKLENQITLIFKDALDVELEDKFDLIFLDAAKAQNIKFFEKFEYNLKPIGTIITDNIYFHGLVEQDESSIESRNVRGIVRKLKNYIEFLENNKRYDTEILKIGDGISISKKKD